jgi:hypothetical protein
MVHPPPAAAAAVAPLLHQGQVKQRVSRVTQMNPTWSGVSWTCLMDGGQLRGRGPWQGLHEGIGC